MVSSIAPTLVSLEQQTQNHAEHNQNPSHSDVGKPHQNVPLLLLHPNGRGTSWFKSTKGNTLEQQAAERRDDKGRNDGGAMRGWMNLSRRGLCA
jgi:hypothetical protein